MRSGYYTTNYINNMPANALNASIEDISEYIFDHTYRQPYPAKFPSLLPKVKHPLFLRNKNNFKTGNALTRGPIEREGHGAQHVSNVAENALIFLNMYIQFGTPETRRKIDELIDLVPGDSREQKTALFIKLLQITAIYHDAGRFGEGADLPEWEANGAAECKAFLMKNGDQ